jgi:hypothetical protein
VLNDIRLAMTCLLDLTATQDVSNAGVLVDVKFNDKVILRGLPVTNLLFLEKQLINLHALVSKIPILDPSENWAYSSDVGCYVSGKTVTTKTKKTPRTHIKYDATKEHPAQVEMYYEDVVIGSFDTLKFSGSLSSDEHTTILSRIDMLRDAVKVSREEVNSMPAKDTKVADAIFDFVFKGD